MAESESNGSTHRVALELAMLIENAERPGGATADRTREYWIELYARCRKVVLLGQTQGQSRQD